MYISARKQTKYYRFLLAQQVMGPASYVHTA